MKTSDPRGMDDGGDWVALRLRHREISMEEES